MTKLSQAQQQVVAHANGALLVVAGPGSGKTRVLTERIRRLLTEERGHYRILALTFTNKAANEMRDRLAEFQTIEQRTFLGTFHSFCLDVVSTRGSAVGVTGNPTVFESYQDRKQVLHQAVLGDPILRAEIENLETKEQSKRLSYWLEKISEAKGQLLPAEGIEDAILNRVYLAYDSGLRASSACDFEDLLLLTYQLFSEQPKIADFYRRQYRYILVDEAQDINEAQYRLLQSLCGDSYRNVMIVGDPKQAIFVWNGANPKYLDLFERDFAAKKIVLTENYRCSRAVVDAAQKLFPDYAVSGQLPIQGEVALIEASDEDEEATLVIDKLQGLLREGHPDIEGPITLERCAFLARTRYAFGAVEERLRNESIPHFKQVSVNEESESDLMINFDLCLRIIANSHDILHFNALVKRFGIAAGSLSPRDGLNAVLAATSDTNTDINALREACSKLLEGRVAIAPALSALERFANSQLDEQVKEIQLRDLAEWKLKWDVYVRGVPGGQQSLPGFLSQIALGRTQPAKREGLSLLTIHSAKGLEFDVVFVLGMAQGTFPDYRAKGPAVDEERRNAFVAVTRSRRLLFLSYPRSKVMPWGDSRFQSRSEFLTLMDL